ncbi:LEAF RUST 10 DISEASE-RESISTANCE LOCUS RECEPTOR-LIKE PROTEIN KINASE-like 2.1 isoform X2 [Gossypium raimondii]|uniref:Protein kinase domain-containing protein n=1 Tax=Gossypium raimondii TaxID=29730 RepID=A0A0D2NV89_GOSRA|nr:LEAF RUST 10 DISEASE-RESISTANCE LOCUS RECEPTOR-LIKE PROTEIN KINASE-like 2.1 isoform X2 [Gossypium raimondii]KJB37202.1 hypothetical protein B456_006G194100 [Gossypium raimondii]
MHHQPFISTPSISISIFTLLLFIIFLLRVSYTQDEPSLSQCFNGFDCGSVKALTFPFWKEDSPEYCRQEGFQVIECEADHQPVIRIGETKFRLVSVDQPLYRMTIASEDLWDQICSSDPSRITNVTLGYSFLRYSDKNHNLTFFYNCKSSFPAPTASGHFRCGQELVPVYADDLVGRGSYEQFFRSCQGGPIQVQVNESAFQQLQIRGPGNVDSEDWKLGFDVFYPLADLFCEKCKLQKGLCENKASSRYPLCKHPGLGSAATALLITAGILFFRTKISTTFHWKFRNRDQDVEAFLKNNGGLVPKRYSYSDIKKMTSSFKEKLGKGGYGSVYKGKLPDGRLVAVKLLNTSKGNGQEFINEVASISRTSHVNIVTLLGLCLEGGKRALIYEFMPNGSLEKFIYGQNISEDNRQHLTVQDLYQIAIGIARGLEYLHLGCNTRILHFDIKPHNILLDDQFCPKISDFGLAKLCGRTDSMVSMLEARGTIGYIAPEVFCRNIGFVSHKSDVYSYGMMVLEMGGGRKNLDVGVHHTSEIYFPQWIYEHIEQGNIEPELLGLVSKEETEIARKMIVVGLWCIQTNPKDRPSISKVKEMLESTQPLQIPPKP